MTFYLLVIEPHMENTFSNFRRVLESEGLRCEVIVLPYQPLTNIFMRLVYGRKYLHSLKFFIDKKVKDQIEPDSIVFFSTGEGFEVGNRRKWFNLNCRIIALQHGKFSIKRLEDGAPLKSLMTFLSKLLYNFIGYQVVGKGFGGVFFDKYIVYGKKYAQYLTTKGWVKESIISCASLLKPIEKYRIELVSKDICILLLQDLVTTSYLSTAQWKAHYSQLIDILSGKFTKVYIKPHPKMNSNLYYPHNFSSHNNVEFFPKGSSISELLLERKCLVFSFFSSGLIDAYLYGCPIIGIKLPQIRSEYYDFLNTKLSINQLKEASIVELLEEKDLSIINDELDFSLSINQAIKSILK